MTHIRIPELALVVLIGPAGSGKTEFAARHFRPTEVLRARFFRGLVADDEDDLDANSSACEALNYVVARRLERRRLTVVNAANLDKDARTPLLQSARRFDCPAVAVVFDLDEAERKPEASQPSIVDPAAAHQQIRLLRGSLDGLRREGFDAVFVLDSAVAAAAATVERAPLPSNHRGDAGPFDIIGDVHGCIDELNELLQKLGYVVEAGGARHLGSRRVVFVGDLVDRGPNSPAVLRLAMSMVAAGQALCVPGNHDDKLLRALRGRKVQVTHGLERSLAQLDAEPPEFRQQVIEFLAGLPTHLVFAEGRLVVAHAGITEELQGRQSRRVRDFVLYGLTTGEVDEFGLPVRLVWAKDYRGTALVVFGHTPVLEPAPLNNTINIDTGCVFGGALTALRWPERELVSVPARETYYVPARPFPGPAATRPQLPGRP